MLLLSSNEIQAKHSIFSTQQCKFSSSVWILGILYGLSFCFGFIFKQILRVYDFGCFNLFILAIFSIPVSSTNFSYLKDSQSMLRWIGPLGGISGITQICSYDHSFWFLFHRRKDWDMAAPCQFIICRSNSVACTRSFENPVWWFFILNVDRSQ